MLAAAAILLAGCATFSADGGFNAVKNAARERVGQQAQWIRNPRDEAAIHDEVTRLLQKPLAADEAVQVTLLNNSALQAQYAELGIAEADLVQAGRLTNPHFSYLRTSNAGESKIEWALTFPFIDLITMPLRTRIEARRFDEVKLAVAGATVGTALEARRAWYEAVAAGETVRYMEQAKAAAEASAELARRMAKAGNFPELTRMRAEVFYVETLTRLAQAKQALVSRRERLARLMGLEESNFTLPDRLPDLPATPAAADAFAEAAMDRRFDVQAARQATEALASSLGLTKVTRVVSVLEFGPARTKEEPGPWKSGYELRLQVPLFDWGNARIAKAQALYMQSVRRYGQVAVDARSEMREAYLAYRSAYDTAKRYRDDIVPLRKQISDENVLRYNGMLLSVFELLADAREQIASVNASIEALRDFWIADTRLQSALNGAPTPRMTHARISTPVGYAGDPALAGH